MAMILLALGPALAIITMAFFFYRGCHNSEKLCWHNIAVSAGLLLLCCGWIIVATIYDLGLIAFIQDLFGSIAAVSAGIWFVIILRGRKRAVGIIFAIGVPLALFMSLELAFPYSPNEIIHKNGESLAAALTIYYRDNKTYPQTLDQLLPNYATDLKEPKSLWGWLYTSDHKDFTLAYVSYIDKWGYTICKYSASSPKWDCPLDYSTEPFHLAPTPWP